MPQDNEYSKIMYKLGSVESKVDSVIERLDRFDKRMDEHFTENTKDISDINNQLSVIKGRTMAISGVIGFAVAAVWSLLKDKIKL